MKKIFLVLILCLFIFYFLMNSKMYTEEKVIKPVKVETFDSKIKQIVSKGDGERIIVTEREVLFYSKENIITNKIILGEFQKASISPNGQYILASGNIVNRVQKFTLLDKEGNKIYELTGRADHMISRIVVSNNGFAALFYSPIRESVPFSWRPLEVFNNNGKRIYSEDAFECQFVKDNIIICNVDFAIKLVDRNGDKIWERNIKVIPRIIVISEDNKYIALAGSTLGTKGIEFVSGIGTEILLFNENGSELIGDFISKEYITDKYGLIFDKNNRYLLFYGAFKVCVYDMSTKKNIWKKDKIEITDAGYKEDKSVVIENGINFVIGNKNYIYNVEDFSK